MRNQEALWWLTSGVAMLFFSLKLKYSFTCCLCFYYPWSILFITLMNRCANITMQTFYHAFVLIRSSEKIAIKISFLSYPFHDDCIGPFHLFLQEKVPFVWWWWNNWYIYICMQKIEPKMKTPSIRRRRYRQPSGDADFFFGLEKQPARLVYICTTGGGTTFMACSIISPYLSRSYRSRSKTKGPVKLQCTSTLLSKPTTGYHSSAVGTTNGGGGGDDDVDEEDRSVCRDDGTTGRANCTAGPKLRPLWVKKTTRRTWSKAHPMVSPGPNWGP